MNKHIETTTAECRACHLVTDNTALEPLIPTPLPEKPWQIGSFPSQESILIVVDGYSRYPEIKVLRKTESYHIIKSLQEIFARHGYPEELKTDNGTNLASTKFENYSKSCAIISILNRIGHEAMQALSVSTKPY